MKTSSVKLTKKQLIFVTEYQRDFNGTQAAIRAGYSPKTAKEMAYQLLHKTSLQEALARDMEERLLQIGVHAERILTELVRVALSDTRKLYREDGSLKPPSEWDDETAAAVEEFSCKEDGRRVLGHRVKLHDKVAALQLLGKSIELQTLSA